MKNLFTIFFLFLCISVSAQEVMQTQTSGMIKFYADRAGQLLESVPDDKLSWTPQEGVRSFSEVYGHLISANYWIVGLIGGKVPEDVDVRNIESQLKTKADIKSALDKSVATLMEAINSVPDEDLTTKIDFPAPGEYNKASGILIGISHINEHLGQLIAYSRMNSITPPWSN